MAEPYMYDYGPKWFFGFGLTRITVNTHDGKVYPVPSGKVSREMEESCKRLHGAKKTPNELINLLKEQLIKDNS